MKMDDGWKTKPQSKSIATIRRRVFIGGLRFDSQLQEKLRDLFAESAINIRGEVNISFPKHLRNGHVGSPTRIAGSECFALVECNVEVAIKCLNGRNFDGKLLIVKSEKKQVDRRKNTKKFGGGWTKPQNLSPATSHTHSPLSLSANKDDFTVNHQSSSPMNHTVPFGEGVESKTLPEDINDLSDQLKVSKEKDELNFDTPSTTARAALTSANFEASDDVKREQKTITSNSGEKEAENGKMDEVSAFHLKCKSGLTHLIHDYGEHDVNFDTKKIDKKKDSHLSQENKYRTSKQTIRLNGMLAPNGKAPIHIQLVSFGYKYSVPPQARQGWSHSNPLSPIDCRDLPRAPHYVAKLSGLSFKVKQAILRECYNNTETDFQHDYDDEEEENNCTSIVEKEHDEKKSNKLKLMSKNIGVKVLKAIKEAINDGGHGYAFPIEITVHIGSEYGRHRSVVLCEYTAQTIRGMLRKTTDSTITDPVSVSTKHRDVDNNHRDDEAFGKDLKREHEAETRRKKKQEWIEDRY